MKATSIEQIREHLARGGRVKSGTLWELTCSIPTGFYLRVNGQLLFMPTDCVAPCNWELLPLDEKPIPGVPASSLPLVTEDPTGESCDNCKYCSGKGGWWDEESIDQWYWCEHCDAAKEYYAPLREKKQRKEKRHHELRAKVLFGQPWSIEEQLEVWELLTGEKIEHGRRCDACNGDGTQFSELTWERVDCPKCEDHPGYTVRPTWMGERV